MSADKVKYYEMPAKIIRIIVFRERKKTRHFYQEECVIVYAYHVEANNARRKHITYHF